MVIRKTKPEEATQLTEIAFAAKRTWDYPEEYFEIWKNELTISTDYINEHVVFVAVRRKKIVGFFSIVFMKKDTKFSNVLVKFGYWLDHIFIDPKFQHKGIGKKLMGMVRSFCEDNWIDELMIFVDPYATGFYEKMGAEFVENSPSLIESREIPVYRLTVEEE